MAQGVASNTRAGAGRAPGTRWPRLLRLTAKSNSRKAPRPQACRWPHAVKNTGVASFFLCHDASPTSRGYTVFRSGSPSGPGCLADQKGTKINKVTIQP